MRVTGKTVKKVVIIGMGYIGIEMCEALRARSIEVDMVKSGPVVLPWMEKEMSDVVRKELVYAPPFGPVWDPKLTAANQLLKKMYPIIIPFSRHELKPQKISCILIELQNSRDVWL